MINEKACVALATLALATGIATAAPVDADDAKNYAGAACVNWSGGTPGYYYAGISNTNASSDMYIDCPIVKDVFGGDYFLDHWIMVIDQNDAESVRCHACTQAMIDGDSSIYGSCSSYIYSGASYYGTNAKELNPPGLLVEYTAYDYQYVSCKVPDSDVGQSRVQSYSANEVVL